MFVILNLLTLAPEFGLPNWRSRQDQQKALMTQHGCKLALNFFPPKTLVSCFWISVNQILWTWAEWSPYLRNLMRWVSSATFPSAFCSSGFHENAPLSSAYGTLDISKVLYIPPTDHFLRSKNCIVLFTTATAPLLSTSLSVTVQGWSPGRIPSVCEETSRHWVLQTMELSL